MRSAAARRGMCDAARRLAFRDGAELWRKSQDGIIGPELFTKLEAARQGNQEVRSALAVALAKRWSVDQVAAKKQDDSVVSTYALRVKQHDGDEQISVGLLRAAIWPEGPDGIKTALLFSLQNDPALPLGLAAYPLIEHARKLLSSESIGVERILGVAALPGLCQWISDERAWERIEEKADEEGGEQFSLAQQRSAVEKVALYQQRPDDATYDAAKEAFKGLALEYAAMEDIEAESTAMALAGGRLVGVHWMHDKSEEALQAAAGCTASYEFDTEEVKHIDLDDKLADH